MLCSVHTRAYSPWPPLCVEEESCPLLATYGNSFPLSNKCCESRCICKRSNVVSVDFDSLEIMISSCNVTTDEGEWGDLVVGGGGPHKERFAGTCGTEKAVGLVESWKIQCQLLAIRMPVHSPLLFVR